MREAEMRRRIEGFLKLRMQGMLAPALGIGLAMAACGDWGGTEYMAQFPREDGGGAHDAGATSEVPVYSSPVPSDGRIADAFVGNDTSSPGADGAWDISSVADADLESDLARADVAQTLDAAKEATGEDAAGSEGHPGVDAGTVVDAGS